MRWLLLILLTSLAALLFAALALARHILHEHKALAALPPSSVDVAIEQTGEVDVESELSRRPVA